MEDEALVTPAAGRAGLAAGCGGFGVDAGGGACRATGFEVAVLGASLSCGRRRSQKKRATQGMSSTLSLEGRQAPTLGQLMPKSDPDSPSPRGRGPQEPASPNFVCYGHLKSDKVHFGVVWHEKSNTSLPQCWLS